MATCGIGSGSGPLPGDPDNVLTLSAAPAFGGIVVSWSFPGTNPHAVAHATIFRGTSTDFNTAVKVGIEGGDSFFDRVNTTNTYYYWIKVTSISGFVGSVIGPASATAHLLLTDLLAALVGAIGLGSLTTEVRNILDQITILQADLAAEIAARIADSVSLSLALADITNTMDAAYALIAAETNNRIAADSALTDSIVGLDGRVVDLENAPNIVSWSENQW